MAITHFPYCLYQPHPLVRYLDCSYLFPTSLSNNFGLELSLPLYLVVLSSSLKMEALGAAASVIAVLSLALQLSQAIENTKD